MSERERERAKAREKERNTKGKEYLVTVVEGW